MKIERTTNLAALADGLFSEVADVSSVEWSKKIRALSKAVTLTENKYSAASNLLLHARATKNKCHVIGITGMPGAGKSTLTNALMKSLRALNKTVALFAVDPSSKTTGGAFLGDRVRMGDHAQDTGVYIRSMASRGALGGVARATRGAVQLAKAAGFDFVVVETVGVGQSEGDILSLADTSVLVLLPHSGDEIQLMKAGVLEHCDIYVVNKTDLHDPGFMISELTENTDTHDSTAWHPLVFGTSAKNKTGLDTLANAVEAHAKFVGSQKWDVRRERTRTEVFDEARCLFEDLLKEQILKLADADLQKIDRGELSAVELAQRTLQASTSMFPNSTKGPT